MWFVLCVVVVIVLYVVIRRANRGSFVDARDGQKYRTVKIGRQVWMAENLNYKIDGSWCYEDNESFGKTWGRLYTWEAAKAACPAGWHLPSTHEWDILIILTINGKHNGGKKLKDKYSWSGWTGEYYDDRFGNGVDKYGFSAKPGGARDSGGRFSDVGHTGYWWTSTEEDPFNAKSRRMFTNYVNVTDDIFGKARGFSVRCVKD